MTTAYVAGYARPDEGGCGETISVFAVDDVERSWQPQQSVGSAMTAPSLASGSEMRYLFLAFSPDAGHLYSVSTGSPGGAKAFALGADGELNFVNEISVGADNPTHVAVGPGGHHLITTNNGAGTVSVISIEADGRLGEVTDVRSHTGANGPHARQDGPHPHQAVVDPSGRFVLVSDLGLDQTFVYTLDVGNGTLVPHDPPFVKASPGAGPRHLAFTPDGRHAYVINELNSTVQVYGWDIETGCLTPEQHVSTLPVGWDGPNIVGEIVVHSNGRYVYGANRGHDSVAIFGIEPGSNRLTALDHVSTLGRTPRHFALDPTGAFLYVANQDSDEVVTFRVEEDGRHLVPAEQVAPVVRPTCLVVRSA